MRNAALSLILAACIHAQNWKDLLLPQPRHVSGVVVDQDGKPLPEARVDHSDRPRPLRLSDAQGRFELDTNAPALVIRKAGFQSELVRTTEAADVRITLRKISDFPTCPSSGKYLGLEGWGASFRFPKAAGVKVSAPVHDRDYGARDYYVNTEQGKKWIRHGSGPMWSFGTPPDEEVWRSVKYQEVAYASGPTIIIDARGQFPDGTRWRSLGKYGETASYYGIDEATANLLDGFLDGACLSKPSHR